MWRRIICASLIWAAPSVVFASAWPQGDGKAELIVKAEVASADDRFDASGDKAVYVGSWEEKTVSFHFDYGLTEKLSVVAKANVQDIQTETENFSGLGSVEIGIKAVVHQTDNTVVSVSVSAEGLGRGRRDDFETTGNKDADLELRGYVGHGFSVAGNPAFVDAQLARRAGGGDRADQWRADLTLGFEPSPQWIVMAQVYAGQTEELAGFQAKWVNAEFSAVYFFGPAEDLGVQFSVRQTLAGENVPQVKGIGIGLWKRF